ncbi:hypothetical protein CGLO_13888 [Colletotrichum gloeosporioides Cg-14]|uniref:Uncharacterized protein n=1 Tax=Colletotrichum gloeosporioides (strain Cg-14) TaxID=1237896 RepID=T0K2S3_COLGC|nr:hypothetical protein CGLO_13888 [Colletotrichum gloeosporioides Cg-14]
MGKRPLKLL